MGLGRAATVLLIASSIACHAVIVIVQKLSSRPGGGGYPFPVVVVTLLSEICKWIGSMVIFRILVHRGKAVVSDIKWRDSIKWSVPALVRVRTIMSDSAAFIQLENLELYVLQSLEPIHDVHHILIPMHQLQYIFSG
jgi:hypothetical protein